MRWSSTSRSATGPFRSTSPTPTQSRSRCASRSYSPPAETPAGQEKTSERGQRGPLRPRDRPVVDVPVGGRQLHGGAGDLDGVAVNRGLKIGLRIGGRQVDATVADVVHALRSHRVLV